MPDWILLPWLILITAGWIGISLTIGRHATAWVAQYNLNKHAQDWMANQHELNKHFNEKLEEGKHDD